MTQETPKKESGVEKEKLPGWVSVAAIELGKFQKKWYAAIRVKADEGLAKAAKYNLEEIDIIGSLRREGKISGLGYWERIRDVLSDNASWLDRDEEWDEETLRKLFPEKFPG